MILIKLLPTFLIAGIILAIITSPFWGTHLRSCKEILQRASELGAASVDCSAGQNWFVGQNAVPLGDIFKKDNFGAKVALVYCVGQRMSECFGEWSAEAIKKLFPRLVVGILMTIGAYFVVFAALPYWQALEPLANVDTFATVFAGLSAVFSVTEIYTAVELSGRYKELVSTGKKLISQTT